MENLLALNVMHASLCQMTSVGDRWVEQVGLIGGTGRQGDRGDRQVHGGKAGWCSGPVHIYVCI